MGMNMSLYQQNGGVKASHQNVASLALGPALQLDCAKNDAERLNQQGSS